MKKFISILILTLCMGVVNANAQEVQGVSIEGNGVAFVVMLDGEQISMPTQSCFIAFPPKGTLLIEAFSVENGRHVRVLLREKLRYRGGIVHLKVDGEMAQRPNATLYPIYNPEEFNRFLKSLERLSFDSERCEQIKAVCGMVGFSCQQAARMCELLSFESNRLTMLEEVVPYLVDPANSYLISEALTMKSSREKFLQMIRKQARRGGNNLPIERYN